MANGRRPPGRGSQQERAYVQVLVGMQVVTSYLFPDRALRDAKGIRAVLRTLSEPELESVLAGLCGWADAQDEGFDEVVAYWNLWDFPAPASLLALEEERRDG